MSGLAEREGREGEQDRQGNLHQRVVDDVAEHEGAPDADDGADGGAPQRQSGAERDDLVPVAAVPLYGLW